MSINGMVSVATRRVAKVSLSCVCCRFQVISIFLVRSFHKPASMISWIVYTKHAKAPLVSVGKAD